MQKKERLLGKHSNDAEAIKKAAEKLDAIIRFLNKNSFTASFIATKMKDMSESKLSKLRNLNTSSYSAETRLAASNEITDLFGLTVLEEHTENNTNIYKISYTKGEPLVSDITYFDFYFCYEYGTMGLARLSVSHDRKSCELIEFKANVRKLHPVIRYYDGEVIEMKDENKFSIYFKKQIRLFDSRSKTSPLFCTFMGNLDDTYMPIKIGSFVFSSVVLCGIALLKQVDASHLQKTELNIPFNISSFLLGASMSPRRITRDDLNNLLKEHFIENNINYHDTFMFKNQKLSEIDNSVKLQVNSYPNERGLIILADLINDAEWVFNTRIFSKHNESFYSRRSNTWQDSIRTNLERGLFFKDVVISDWSDNSIGLKNEFPNQYFASIVTLPYKSQINLTIIGFKNGSEELWVGWAISSAKGLEHPCFQLKDPGLIQFFKSWYYDLFESGKEVYPSKP